MTEFYFIYMACVCMCVQVCKYLLPQTILLLILCTFESIFFPNVISGLKHLKFLFTFLILILGRVLHNRKVTEFGIRLLEFED